MGISLAVGRLTLDQVAEVRILHPQPTPDVLKTPSLREKSSMSLPNIGLP